MAILTIMYLVTCIALGAIGGMCAGVFVTKHLNVENK